LILHVPNSLPPLSKTYQPTHISTTHPSSLSRKLFFRRRQAHELYILLPDPPSHLSAFVHLILIGMDGRIFQPSASTLEQTLQIPSSTTKALYIKLNTHSVIYAHVIVCNRRRLDFDPTAWKYYRRLFKPIHRHPQPP
jgi:hypothetical protein